jgi:hypothetical protein
MHERAAKERSGSPVTLSLAIQQRVALTLMNGEDDASDSNSRTRLKKATANEPKKRSARGASARPRRWRHRQGEGTSFQGEQSRIATPPEGLPGCDDDNIPPC